MTTTTRIQPRRRPRRGRQRRCRLWGRLRLLVELEMGPKPNEFIRFGPMDATKPYTFIGFGDIHGPKPYKCIGLGDIHGPKPYKFIEHRQMPVWWEVDRDVFSAQIQGPRKLLEDPMPNDYERFWAEFGVFRRRSETFKLRDQPSDGGRSIGTYTGEDLCTDFRF